MKRILAIWLPDWPAQRLASTRPELQDRAVILHRATSRGRCVAACSPAARKFGVRDAMPVAEAAALVRENNRGRKEGAAPFHLEAYDPQADRLALEKLAGWCYQYSPCVGLEDVDPPETLLLDATGIAPLFGGEQAFLEQVARGFRRLRLRAQLALADTVGAAWAVSHYGCPNRAIAKARVVDVGGSCAAIELLPIAALRLPPAMVETLGRVGLERIGELLVLPRVELQARFTTFLLQRLDQALGAAAETICASPPPPEFMAQCSLEYPVDRRDAIDQVIQQLVERLTRRLAAAGEGALRLACQLNCHPAPPARVEIGLFQPSANAPHLLELIGLQMEHVKLPGPVNAVLIQVTQHARFQWRQQELFDQEQRRSDSPQVAALVDRLTSRLGRQAVVRCVLQSDAQPEMAYRQEPLVDRSQRQKNSRLTSLPLAPLDRPLCLLAQPIAVPVMAMAPAGPPVRFRYGGREHYVARHWGPERIETGWWRRRGVQRDYYRVETQAGHRFWLFRQLRRGEWFLHGVFD